VAGWEGEREGRRGRSPAIDSRKPKEMGCTHWQGREGLKGLRTPVSNHLSASFALSLISRTRAMQGEALRAFVSKLFPYSKLSVFSLPSKGS
jgi:hypothetical protein